MIHRPDYVNAILPFVGAPLVKNLSGVRRCGKSTILEMMKDHYHKYVVAMDKLAIGNDEGIAFVHIADFLLMDKW